MKSVELTVDDVCKSFVDRAVALKATDEMQSLHKNIEDFYAEPVSYEPKKFFAVSAPPGSRKTQLAFNLAEFKDLDVLHVYLNSEEPLVAGTDISHLLVKALGDDLASHVFAAFENLPLVDYSSACAYSTASFHTVAVLSSCFGIVAADGAVISSVQALRKAVNDICKVGSMRRKPVVCVDEAHLEHPSAFQRALFLSSILRATGIAAIFMDTTSRIVDLVQVGAQASSAYTQPWAHFISNLPPIASSVLNMTLVESMPLQSLLAEVGRFPHCNPQLVRHLHSQALLHRDATIQHVVAKVADTLYNQKKSLRWVEGVRAQLRYILDVVGIAQSPTFVDNHFASFRQNDEVRLEGGYLVSPNQYDGLWNPKAYFSSSCEDPLLSMVLSGPCVPGLGFNNTNAHPAPFVYDPTTNLVIGTTTQSSARVTLTSAAAALLVHSAEMFVKEQRGGLLNHIPADHREGCLLLSMGMVACCCASRAGGFEGILAADFIRFLTTELQATIPSNNMALEWMDDEVEPLSKWWSKAGSTKLPCLLRVNDTQPLQLEALNFGTITCDTTDRHEARIENNGEQIYIETVDRANGVDSKMMQGILSRFWKYPGHPSMGIAIVTRLANIRKTLNATMLADVSVIHIKLSAEVEDRGVDRKVTTAAAPLRLLARRIGEPQGKKEATRGQQQTQSKLDNSKSDAELPDPRPRALLVIECDHEKIKDELVMAHRRLAMAFRMG